MNVEIERQNIIILFWKYLGCTVSIPGIYKSEYWILTGPSFSVLTIVEKRGKHEFYNKINIKKFLNRLKSITLRIPT
jgi:hypothetical protein